MENGEDKQLLCAALELGEHLLECGGEISRVEDTVKRICAAYGASRTDVFAITSSIVVTMERNGQITTQTRRINGGETDYTRLEDLNALSRRICRETPPVDTLREMVRGLAGVSQFSSWLQMLGYMLASGAFAVFFGGNIPDALCSAVCGVLILLCNRYFRRLWESGLLYALFCSFAAGVAAWLCSRLGLCTHADKVMIGDIMLLIPGISFTNALRDLFVGDTISGLLRMMEALLQAGVIACGFALALLIGTVPVADGAVPAFGLQILTGALGSLGFGILFRMRPRHLPWALLGGGVTWCVYLLVQTFNPMVATLVASMAAHLWAMVMAHWRKSPSTIFSITAVVPLIPGSGLYYTMSAVVAGSETALNYGAQALMTAAAIGFGALLFTAAEHAVRLVIKQK